MHPRRDRGLAAPDRKQGDHGLRGKYMHINCLELLAATFATKTFAKS